MDAAYQLVLILLIKSALNDMRSSLFKTKALLYIYFKENIYNRRELNKMSVCYMCMHFLFPVAWAVFLVDLLKIVCDHGP